MPSVKNAVVLVIITFLLVIMIYSSVAKFDVLARKKVVYTGCTDRDPTIPGATSALQCCWTNTVYDDTTGKITHVYSTCRTCEYDSKGNMIDCRDTSPLTSTGLGNPISAGPTQPPSTPPRASNETGVNNPPGNIGIVQPPSPPPSLNAIPPPSVLPSPTKQQTLTTTCPNGLLPDANGNCPPTTNTNQQSGSTSNNNNPQQGHHHKGSNNQPTQTGGAGQESTVTKKHKGSKTDQGTIVQPPS